MTSCSPKQIKPIALLENNILETKEATTVSKGYEFNDRHYHFTEALGDKLFAVCQRENPDNSDDWSDGLWCFSPYDESKLIVEGKGIDYRVCANTEYIAVTVDDCLKIFNEDGDLVQTIMNSQLLSDTSNDLQLEGWNEAGDILWCSANETYSTVAYISINITTLDINIYDTKVFDSDEYSLNPNTGWIVFSDFPVVLDVIALDEYMISGQTTTLSIYNLKTDEEIIIDTAPTNRFKPKWDLQHNELTYYKGYKLYSYQMVNE